MAKIFDKMRSFFGGDDVDDEFEGYEDEGYDYEPSSRAERETPNYAAPSRPATVGSSRGASRRNTSQVVSIHTNVQMQVCIIRPECYEDAQEICDQVKERKPVVVNLEKVEYPTAQRIMDFLSGTCYSLEGTIQRVANNIFIIAPENVDVSGDLKEELKTKGIILPWTSQGK